MTVSRILTHPILLLFASLALPSTAAAGELTPEVRARLYAPTADVRIATKVATIPMRGTDRAGNYKCPYFQVTINGRGPFTFLLDTGAAYTLVSSRVVKAARTAVMFDRKGQRDVVRLDSLSLGAVTLKDVWAIHDDNFGVDGIIGFPALGNSNVLFDFARRQMLVSRDPIPMPASFTLPYDVTLNVPVIPLRIGVRTVPILIDTGDDAYGLELRKSELGNAAIEHPPIAASSVMNGANAQPTSITTLKEQVKLGPVHAASAVVAINDALPIGDLGYDALRQFRFQFDPKRRLVTFQPLFRGAEFKLPPTRNFGFIASFSSGDVRNVVPSSAAARAGMRSGDRVMRVNRRPITGFNPRSWNALLDRKASIAVEWLHDGKARHAHLPLNDMR